MSTFFHVVSISACSIDIGGVHQYKMKKNHKKTKIPDESLLRITANTYKAEVSENTVLNPLQTVRIDM